MKYTKKVKLNLFFLINLSIIVSLFTLFIPLGFSPDSMNYQFMLNNPEFNNNLVLKNLSYIINNYQYVNFIYSLTMLVIFSYTFYKMSKIPLVTFILFLCLEYPNFGLIQIRSGVAIALFYLSLYYFLEKKLLLSLLLLMIGSLFHISLLVFIVIILLLYFPLQVYYILPFIGILFYKLNIFEFLITIFLNSSLKDLFPSIFLIKLQGYIQGLSWDISINKINVLSKSIISEILFLLIFYFFIKLDKYEEIFFKLFSLGIFFWFFFAYIPVFSQRFFNYLLISQFYLIPSLYKNFKFKPKLIGFLIIFIFIIIICKQGIFRYIIGNVFNFSVFW